MQLPRPALATRTIELAGASVELRSLTFSEARRMRDLSEPERVAWMVSCATGLTPAEADDWLGSVSTELAADLLLAITELSGLEDSVRIGPKATAARKRTSGS